MTKKSRFILSSLCCSLGLIFAAPHIEAAQSSFFDHFDVPPDRLDSNKWTTEFGDPSFLGRTQLRDWVKGQGKFAVADSKAQLALDTYNPTNNPEKPPAFYGSHAKTLMSFKPDESVPGYKLEVKAQLDPASLQQPGIVYGFYLYGCEAGPCATNHDELGIEILTKPEFPGGPPRVQLNRYANEPLGPGHGGPSFNLPSDFNWKGEHVWRIDWTQHSANYFVDKIPLGSTATVFIPHGSMQANMIAWGPGPEWGDAYSPSLQPVTDPLLNHRFVAYVDSVSVTPIPEPDQWLMLLVGLAIVIAGGSGRRMQIPILKRTA